jgi:glycosyltransferase involved in cell wall biosynthesis
MTMHQHTASKSGVDTAHGEFVPRGAALIQGPRVGVVMPLASPNGGAERMLLHLLSANRAEPRADYCLAFLSHGPMVDQVADMGYAVEVFDAGQVRDVVRYTRAVRDLARWLRRRRVDVALSWMSKAHLYTGVAARLARVPAAWWQHGIPDGHWIDRLATRLPARQVFCCSGAAMEAQRRLGPHRAARVIYPAVDLSEFQQETLPPVLSAREQLGLPSGGPVVGIVARLQRWKGVHIFVEAAAQITRSRPDVQFVIVGGEHPLETDYPGTLSALICERGLEEHVRMVGAQTNVPLWMQAMDVVVHASIEPEPFGMVIIEGMALGKTVVASRAGGPLEIIEDNVNGLLVEPNCPRELAEAVLSALRNQTAGIAIADAARLRAHEFSADRLATDLAESLRAMTGSLQARRVAPSPANGPCR